MAARKGVGLSDMQLDRLREQLAAGGKPRVRVSGPQFANQPTGTVLAVGTPESDGDDFVTVRVKVSGVTDELRFSPRELTFAAASGRTARATLRADTTAGAQQNADRAQTAVSKTATKTAAAKRSAPVGQTIPGADAPDNQKTRRMQTTAGATTADPSPRSRGGAPATARPAAGSAGTSRRRGAQLPTVSVTLTSAGATWFVSARRGSRAIVKNASVPPGVVSAVAEVLELPAVTDAVSAVNDVALQEAEARAAALRAELAALEAELNSHRRP